MNSLSIAWILQDCCSWPFTTSNNYSSCFLKFIFTFNSLQYDFYCFLSFNLFHFTDIWPYWISPSFSIKDFMKLFKLASDWNVLKNWFGCAFVVLIHQNRKKSFILNPILSLTRQKAKGRTFLSFFTLTLTNECHFVKKWKKKKTLSVFLSFVQLNIPSIRKKEKHTF